MKHAIELAKEIIRKENAINNSESHFLKTDYRKSIVRDKNELLFYCGAKDLRYSVVMSKAKEELDEEFDIQKKIKEAGES